MNILWIYNMPLVPEAGGTERITSLISKGLSARGHKCHGILVFNDKEGIMTYESEPVTDLYRFLKDRHIDIVINQMAYVTWLLESFLRQGGDRWRSEGGRIYSCLHFDPKFRSPLYFYRNVRNKTPRIYLNIVKSILLHPYYSGKQLQNAGKTYNWLYDNSDYFITLSECHFEYLKKVTARDNYDRLIAIHNPLTFDSILPASSLKGKKRVILVCARMDEYEKRISLVLKAWKRLLTYRELEGWELKIIGDGTDLTRYKNYVATHGLERIWFGGRQKPQPYYEEASIFLMTSYAEGWGLTITESLQNGVVPVVMNTCPVYSDIIENGYNGFLTPGSSVKSFVDHILKLINDNELLGRMRRNALESAQRFTLCETIDKWEKLISE